MKKMAVFYLMIMDYLCFKLYLGNKLKHLLCSFSILQALRWKIAVSEEAQVRCFQAFPITCNTTLPEMIAIYYALNFTNLQVLLLKNTKELNNTDFWWNNVALDNVKAIFLCCVILFFFFFWQDSWKIVQIVLNLTPAGIISVVIQIVWPFINRQFDLPNYFASKIS